MAIPLFACTNSSVAQQPFEYVERKGLGHPDSICDSVMEAAAASLRQEYIQRCGRVLHHNLDKALLVAGQSEPRFGGGTVRRPMQIIAGDRATSQLGELHIPVDEIIETAVLGWFSASLPRVAAGGHVDFQSKVQPGSAELTGIFDRGVPVANDTSAAVGYAPLTETERLVLETEHYLNSRAFKSRFPAAGEDVKVMAVRREKHLHCTLAIAFVDQFLRSESDYFEQKSAIREDVWRHVAAKLVTLEELEVDINMLDDPSRGQAGMYLTVLGTSAESGDGGEVGRGNAVNGLISLNRPTSNEAAAGKNTTCHVGNIYTHLTYQIAAELVASLTPVTEAYVWLCSQIGRPIDQPWSTSVQVALEPDVALSEVREAIEDIVRRRLQHVATTTESDY